MKTTHRMPALAVVAFVVANLMMPGLSHSEVENPAPIAKTGQMVSYSVGDDGDLAKGVAWPDPRFSDNLDGTITDRLTGLVWLMDATRFSGANWNGALASCNALADDGAALTDGSLAGDWRLPNNRELRSLIDLGNSNPALPAGHPFVVPPGAVFWTSTTATNNTGRAWTIDDGAMVNDPKNTLNRVWPVRNAYSGGVGPAPVPRTGQAIAYGSRDDGELQEGVEWPDPRFSDNFDGTVTDNLTGLIWLRNSLRFADRSFSSALTTCNALADDGVALTDGSVAGDWRLPNLWELGSLSDFSQIGPALPLGHPFIVGGAGSFWSSTTTAANANRAWNVGMGIGRIQSAAKGQLNQAWPVRGETPNRPPVADAGPDEQFECTSPGGAMVTLDGSGSNDPDSAFGTNDDIVSFGWYENFGQPSQIELGSGEMINTTLPLGAHVITLEVTDRGDLIDTDDAVKTVIDTTRPQISQVGATPNSLWPPNHRLINVEVTVTATDSCGTPTLILESVTSSELDNGQGDGNTVDDIQDVDVGTPDFELSLRAERAAAGNGRIYTATYRATDESGNTAAESGIVMVPHDESGTTDPLELLVGESEDGTLLTWSEVATAESYRVIRGRLGSIAETDLMINLGAVTCVENHAPGGTTATRDDTVVPPPGEAFFYLLEYYDGTGSSYGTESTPKPRAPSTGDCD